jgi:hypothetical protein
VGSEAGDTQPHDHSQQPVVSRHQMHALHAGAGSSAVGTPAPSGGSASAQGSEGKTSDEQGGIATHTSRWPFKAANHRSREPPASASAGWVGWLSSSWHTCAAHGGRGGAAGEETESKRHARVQQVLRQVGRARTSRCPCNAAVESAQLFLSDACAGWGWSGLSSSAHTARWPRSAAASGAALRCASACAGCSAGQGTVPMQVRGIYRQSLHRAPIPHLLSRRRHSSVRPSFAQAASCVLRRA